ncbi:MAG: HD-GYP domain-containing protein [Candidatus Woesearchaeota archaeon]
MTVETLDCKLEYLKEHFPKTFAHSERVGDVSKKIGLELALPYDKVELLYVAGLFHDIGKVYLGPELVENASTLSNSEKAVFRNHTLLGSVFVNRHTSEYGEHECKVLSDVARAHHDFQKKSFCRNKSYYLNGTKPYVEIISFADMLDALSQERSYQEKLPIDEALEVARENFLGDERIPYAAERIFLK